MTASSPSSVPDRRDLANDVVIVHSDDRVLMDLTARLSGMRYNVIAVDAIRAMTSAARHAERHPLAMIVSFDGTENVAEIRALTQVAPSTKFLFLAPEMPPRAPVARIVNRHGSAILGQDESSVVIVGTLVALLAPEAPETT